MKRFLSVLLTFCLLITILPTEVLAAAAEPSVPGVSTSEYTVAGLQNLPTVPGFDFEFLPPGEKWKTMAAGDAPATFKKVTYQLADGVVKLDSTISDKIASAGQLIAGSATQDKSPEKIIHDGGYIKQNVLNSALAKKGRKAEPGTIVFDPQDGTSFKIASSTAFADDYGDTKLDKQAKALENTYMIEQPRINEVLKDFSIGGEDGETVNLTRGNITGFAPGVEACVVPDRALKSTAFGDALKDYQYLKGSKLINLQFEDTELQATSGGKTLTIRLSGGLGISNIGVDAKYSAFKGYHLIMDVAEEFYLVAEIQGEIRQEIRIPLYGIDIPFGIGSVSGGLFLIVGIDGNIRIEADAREYTSARMGVKGKTFFGVPVSVKGVFDKEFKKDGDVDIAGEINGYVRLGPLIDIRICGIDLIGAGALGGVELKVAADPPMLDIDLCASLQVYITIIGKTVNLIHWTPSLLHKRQMDTDGYKVNIEEAFIEIGRVGGYIEDTKGSINKVRAPAGIDYRILVYPKGVDPLNYAEADIRIYPQEGWKQLSDEGEFFYEDGVTDEDPDTILYGGDRVAVQFVIEGKTYTSDPVEALFPYDKVTISESDYFNDFVTGNVAPVKVIKYDAQQVPKPGDPADPPDKQFEYRYYHGPLKLQGLSGFMMGTAAKDPLTQKPISGKVYMPIPQGSQVTVMTDEHGDFDSRNPQMLPDRTYDPVFNGGLQIRPGAVFLGGGKFDYSKNKNIAAVKATFDELEHTSSHTIMINPGIPLSLSRTLSFVEGSYKRYNEGEKIVSRMQYDETMYITNGGGTRTVTQEEVTEFYVDGWSTQDVIGFEGGKFLGENDKAPILSHTVAGNGFTVTPVLDDDGDPASTAMVTKRVILEWVWQEHPLPTKITSADHGTVIAGGSFQAEGSGIWPWRWSLQDAPKGISIDPATGKITAAAGMKAQDYSFTVQLEQDPEYFQTEGLKTLPMSNGTISLRLNKGTLDWITDFGAKNLDNPAMNGESPINFIGHDPAPPAEQAFTLSVTELSQPPETVITKPDITAALTAPVIAEEEHGYVFTKLVGDGDLSVPVTASGSAPITWSLEQKSDRYFIPEEATIDPVTGVLTVKEGIEPGNYSFLIRAENDAGFDTQECGLKVTSPADLPQRPDLPRLPGLHLLPGLFPPSGISGQVVTLAAITGPAVQMPALTPKNSTTIRVDHINDRYTFDRNHVNGAEFIQWNSVFKLNIEGSPEELTYAPGAQMCDSYHIYIDMSDPKLKETVTDMGKRIQDIKNAKDNLGAYLQKQVDQYVTNPWNEGAAKIPGLQIQIVPFDSSGLSMTTEKTLLRYGATVDAINASKGGSHIVELGGTNGTSVTGKFFGALAQNPAASIAFRQEGAVITFQGSDVRNASEDAMFDFGFSTQAEHGEQMKAALSDRQNSFVYSFLGHGELPGMATFAITTDIAEGTKVNVYKFDAAANQFSLVAGNVAVGKGGVVTYRNNTMSEYLVTAKTISDKAISGQSSGKYTGASSWAESEIDAAVKAGLTIPDILKDFQKSITREEFCKIVVKLFGALSGKTALPADPNPFTDTNNAEILKAYRLGIVEGKGANKFAPDSNITRQEICVMLQRALKAVDPEGNYSAAGSGRFPDEADIAAWATDAVHYMNEEDIMKGVGGNRIDPLGNTTREQAISLVYRTYMANK